MTNQCKAKMTEIVPQTQLKAVKETQRVRQLAWNTLRRERPTLYFEDEQLDEVVSFLFAVIRETPRARQQNDWIDVIMNVLVP
uniref:Uncharacterized protein n=1 Tax=Knipowitschia caucasica TaxID=637954 RepID=A0AAV2IW85_KNICA